MRSVIWILICLVLAVGGYLLLTQNTTSTPDNETAVQYTNDTYGIAFDYPNTYQIREIEVGNGERGHYSITLADSEALRNLPEAGEGPPAITIDIFQNDLDKLSINDWIRNSSNSNYKLSPDGVLASTTLSSAQALSYTWDGLYRGRSLVAAHRDSIVMVSGQFLTPEDGIVSDFETVISSMTFY